ncbi:MAG: NAD(P)/FAD-dependent oxidoreductase [Desulfatiglandales bacterium]
MISAEDQKIIDGMKSPGKEEKRFVVVGGGSAGSFFAIHLLREAKRLGQDIEVLIIEKNEIEKKQDNHRSPEGGDSGAEVTLPTFNTLMDQWEIENAGKTIQREIDRVWIHGMWKNIPLKVPKKTTIHSVLRAALPAKIKYEEGGVNAFLLRKAIQEGAQVLTGEVLKIESPGSGMLYLASILVSGKVLSIPASFVTVATGVNARSGGDYRDSEIMRSIQRINPDFVPARPRRTIVFDLRVPRESLVRNLNNEVHFIEYGSKTLALERITLIPRGVSLTVAAIGKLIDCAVFPEETFKVIRQIVGLPQLERILPDIASCPVACARSPMMTVGVARNPYGDGLCLIGDVVGSRLHKDGLYAPYLTGSRLAHIVLHHGSDKKTLSKLFGKEVKWLSWDNRFGRLVIRVMQLGFSNPLMSRILYQTFATELKIRDKSKRPLGDVLWKIACGDSDYREILMDMFNCRILRSFMIGGVLVTVRNILTELFFGLRWGEYGRYPTVIPKEKRKNLKTSIFFSLGTALDASPEFERMYAIKIKASKRAIFEELGKFGDERRRYLNLRFVEIVRTSGLPNQLDSTIRYKASVLPIALDMHLKRVVPEEVLFYEVSEKFADRGKLIFEIRPTKDGNHRLVIYTAFDFKRGGGVGTKIFWRFFRLFFPAFLHDIVWNHALCTIKQEAESAGKDLVV